MDTRLQTLLHDLATEMPVDIEGTAPRTLRRARGRRVLTGGAGAAIAVALVVVVSMSALRFGDDPTVTPAVTGPNPSATFAGLWPETNPEALAETQAAVRRGPRPAAGQPRRGSPRSSRSTVLGWAPGDDQAENVDVRGSEAEVVISNRTFGDTVPPVIIEARQLGRTGPRGVWSVVGRLHAADPARPGGGDRARRDRGSPAASTDVYDGAAWIDASVFDGPKPDPSLGSARYELTDRTFAFEIHVSPTPDGRATLLVTMPDAVGASLGAVMVPVPTPVGEPEPPAGPEPRGRSARRRRDRPADLRRGARRVTSTRSRQLLDPNTFAYNFDDGSDPIPGLAAEPVGPGSHGRGARAARRRSQDIAGLRHL